MRLSCEDKDVFTVYLCDQLDHSWLINPVSLATLVRNLRRGYSILSITIARLWSTRWSLHCRSLEILNYRVSWKRPVT